MYINIYIYIYFFFFFGPPTPYIPYTLPGVGGLGAEGRWTGRSPASQARAASQAVLPQLQRPTA